MGIINQAWRGLLRKEGILLKWTFLSLLLVNMGLFVLEISPVIPVDQQTIKLSKPLNVLFYLHMYMGACLFIQSFVTELKRPDIWLHSPYTMKQLVGAKVMYAAFAVACSWLSCMLAVSAFQLITGSITYHFNDIALLIGFGVIVVLNAVYVMVMSFFIMSIYQVLAARIGSFSLIVTAGILIIGVFGWGILWFTDLYQSLKEWGPVFPVKGTDSALPVLEVNFIATGLMSNTALFSVGSLLIYGVVIVAAFAAATALFEKKVRL